MGDFSNDRYRPTPRGLRPGADLSEWIWFVPAGALVLAILPLPYVYYMGLRWLVAGTSIFLAWKEYDLHGRSANSYCWIFGAITVLFNPILPVFLPKLAWVVIDLVVAATFIGHYRLRIANS
ncbi:DUF6804 family protein [Rhodovulum adriaticum]|uniref:Uncharacterized protein n=1 Tax=Rhodovulum adriaticum TaxID=35804 RepID=A0A4R2NNE3_RHOAD|nr:DUF6804 family protein [Rhodovulum adriaticum]MBK1634365.1 hypothetical protein [Rhodovulum adriaticum]TCP23269.1 hypothetical protein EV656_104244 [Rhodovulum adriaticum]